MTNFYSGMRRLQRIKSCQDLAWKSLLNKPSGVGSRFGNCFLIWEFLCPFTFSFQLWQPVFKLNFISIAVHLSPRICIIELKNFFFFTEEVEQKKRPLTDCLCYTWTIVKANGTICKKTKVWEESGVIVTLRIMKGEGKRWLPVWFSSFRVTLAGQNNWN